MDKITELLKNEKIVRLIVGLGLAGMVLIMVSSFFTKEAAPTTKAQPIKADQWVVETQAQLEDILKNIKGVGACRVMITIEESASQIYAKDEKKSSDENITKDGVTEKIQRRDDAEQKHIYVDQGSDKQALLIKEVVPKVRGVIIVCEGADNPIIENVITQAVKTSLGVGPSQVCVAQFNNDPKKTKIFK